MERRKARPRKKSNFSAVCGEFWSFSGRRYDGPGFRRRPPYLRPLFSPSFFAGPVADRSIGRACSGSRPRPASGSPSGRHRRGCVGRPAPSKHPTLRKVQRESRTDRLREAPDIENVKISGTFLTKVFDGPYNAVPRWIKEMDGYVKSQGKQTLKYYFYYTTSYNSREPHICQPTPDAAAKRDGRPAEIPHRRVVFLSQQRPHEGPRRRAECPSARSRSSPKCGRSRPDRFPRP